MLHCLYWQDMKNFVEQIPTKFLRNQDEFGTKCDKFLVYEQYS